MQRSTHNQVNNVHRWFIQYPIFVKQSRKIFSYMSVTHTMISSWQSSYVSRTNIHESTAWWAYQRVRQQKGTGAYIPSYSSDRSFMPPIFQLVDWQYYATHVHTGPWTPLFDRSLSRSVQAALVQEGDSTLTLLITYHPIGSFSDS